MHAIVCIKQVPDTTEVKINPETNTLIREGVESIINPLDYVAMQAALELRDREGGKVSVITMGPPQSEIALREALAVGADHAVLLTDPAFAGADTLATSHVLATAVSRLDPFPDLVMCGMQTIDSDTGHVGPQLAEELDLPQVSGVNEIRAQGPALVVRKVSDGFLDTIRVTLPALLIVNRALCRVKDLPLGALEKAFSEMDITRWGLKDLGLARGEVGMEGSATRVWKLKTPTPRREGETVSGTPGTLVGHLMRRLEALSILDEADGND